MKNEKNIEELFRDGLQNYEAPVDPAIWNSIQSSIGAGGSAAAGASGFSLLKIAVGVLIAGGVGVGIYALVDNSKETEPLQESEKKQVVIEEPTLTEAEETDETPVSERNTGWVEIKVEKNDPLVPRQKESSDQTRTELTRDNADIVETSVTDQAGNTNRTTETNPTTSGEEVTTNEQKTNEKKDSEEKNPAESPALQPEIILSETEGEAPLDVVMEARNTEGVVFWQILGPEGNVDTKGKAITHTFNKPGNYLVVATVLDEEGNQVRKETAVQVYPREILKISQKLRAPRSNSYAISPQGFNNKLELEFDMDNIDTESFILVVWARSGEEVFRTNNINEFWDGRHQNGGYVEAGQQYFVLINVKDKAGNAQKPIKTSVFVTR